MDCPRKSQEINSQSDLSIKKEPCDFVNEESLVENDPIQIPTVFPELKVFMCTFCDAVLEDGLSFEKHISTVHGEKNRPFKCEICQFCFVQKAHLTRHIKGIYNRLLQKSYSHDKKGSYSY